MRKPSLDEVTLSTLAEANNYRASASALGRACTSAKPHWSWHNVVTAFISITELFLNVTFMFQSVDCIHSRFPPVTVNFCIWP